MSETKWVQHISGQGEKWELTENQGSTDLGEWRVHAKTRGTYHFLPQSEFPICEPPEQWEDVTGRVGTDFNRMYINDVNWPNVNQHYIYLDSEHGHNYRLRRVPVNFVGPERSHGCEKGEAFIVERRQP